MIHFISVQLYHSKKTTKTQHVSSPGVHFIVRWTRGGRFLRQNLHHISHDFDFSFDL